MISPEGVSQEVRAVFIKGIPTLSQEDLEEYFAVTSGYEPEKKAFFVFSKTPPKFHTYLVKSEKKEPVESEEEQETKWGGRESSLERQKKNDAERKR